MNYFYPAQVGAFECSEKWKIDRPKELKLI